VHERLLSDALKPQDAQQDILVHGKAAVMKIAIPIWEDKVSPVFDTAVRLLVIECKDKQEVSRLLYHIGEEDLSWKCHRIKELEPDVIICGAVSYLFLNMLRAADLPVIQQISGRIEEIIEAYLKDDSYNSRYLMPGCRKQGYGCTGRKRIVWQQKDNINKEDV
jgi:predicted Fe-Mo cluster-binding NifX family protein